MTSEQVFVELKKAMVEMFELEEESIARESTLGDDLDLDSIDAIDLIVKMQELTGKKIDQEALKSVRTVGDIADVVARLLTESAS